MSIIQILKGYIEKLEHLRFHLIEKTPKNF